MASSAAASGEAFTKRESRQTPGSSSARSGGSRLLGSAASNILANTPRGPGSSGSGPSGSAPASARLSMEGAQAPSRHNSSSSSGSNDRSYARQASLMKDFDIGMMNGSEASKTWAAPKAEAPTGRQGSPHASVDSGHDSDESIGSHVSIRQLKKNMSEGRRGDIKGESTHVRLHLDDCVIEADKEQTAGRWKRSALTDFRLLCGHSDHRDGLIMGLGMYGLKTPNRCQETLIPAVLYFLGKHLEGIPDEKGPVRSCISIQGPQCGKTSSAVLAALAVIDPAVQKPQAIFVSRSSKLEIVKFLTALAMAKSFTYQAFEKDETGLDLDIDESSPEVLTARTAHILVGDPGRLRKALSSGAKIPLDGVKVFVVDDAHELFNGGASSSPDISAPSEEASPTKSGMRLSGLPSGEKRGTLDEVAGNASSSAAAPEEATEKATSAIEDVVEICKMLDVAKAVKIPYLILSEEAKDKPTKKMMKMLKSSMSLKKNLLSVESCTAPMKLIKAMKHYYAEATSTEWVRLFANLVQALTFPRALIYCDDENIHQYLRDMQSMGIAVSANLPGATAEARRCALGDFSANKTQFLLTHSEPAVCQFQLPKVSCVFHFGILSQLPSVYGVRLSPLDAKLKKESASILLVDPDSTQGKDAKAKESKPGNMIGDTHPVVAKLQKVFGISFMDMPLEMLPARSGRK